MSRASPLSPTSATAPSRSTRASLVRRRATRLPRRDLAGFAADLDVLVVCHGAPFVSSEVLAAAPHLTLLGELEGDRFSYRIDLSAAHQRDVRVVDTSHGSSAPTAEWALGLALIGLRNAGALFRRTIAHEPTYLPASKRSGPGYDRAELAGKRVGMLGFGHVARHLVELLRPFGVEIVAHDPFVGPDVAEAFDIALGPLPAILACDVVFVLVPETPTTVGMLGARGAGAAPSRQRARERLARARRALSSAARAHCGAGTSSPRSTSSTPSRSRSTPRSSISRTCS